MIKDIYTKVEYNKILFDSIDETKKLINQFPQILMYKNILDQLEYIKSIVIDQNRKPTREEAKPVTLGNIAVKNFEYEVDLYAQNLMHIFGNFVDYEDLK